MTTKTTNAETTRICPACTTRFVAVPGGNSHCDDCDDYVTRMLANRRRPEVSAAFAYDYTNGTKASVR